MQSERCAGDNTNTNKRRAEWVTKEYRKALAHRQEAAADRTVYRLKLEAARVNAVSCRAS